MKKLTCEEMATVAIQKFINKLSKEKKRKHKIEVFYYYVNYKIINPTHHRGVPYRETNRGSNETKGQDLVPLSRTSKAGDGCHARF